ncbi:hypothetical protein [Qipengyuania sp. ASV99]|uniref:hypothetical protein n=1 Tax=Qipengyuania sp. ASV99 TaxID=3399681 RepID=UPI003A4C53FE
MAEETLETVRQVLMQPVKENCRPAPQVTFIALESVPRTDLMAHMRDPRIARHLPLLRAQWDDAVLTRFLSDKAAAWARDGLGHWAIMIDGAYAGWGGFQKEGPDWDYGLVLRAEFFSLGMVITRAACAWLVHNTSIRDASVLLPLSRSPRALARIGARRAGEADYDGIRFARWALPVQELANAARILATFRGKTEC